MYVATIRNYCKRSKYLFVKTRVTTTLACSPQRHNPHTRGLAEIVILQGFAHSRTHGTRHPFQEEQHYIFQENDCITVRY